MNKDQMSGSINGRFLLSAQFCLLILFAYLLPAPEGITRSTPTVTSLATSTSSPGKRVLVFKPTAPFQLFATEDGLTVIVIAVFHVTVSGAFNVMDKTKGIGSIIGYLIEKYRDKYL